MRIGRNEIVEELTAHMRKLGGDAGEWCVGSTNSKWQIQEKPHKACPGWLTARPIRSMRRPKRSITLSAPSDCTPPPTRGPAISCSSTAQPRSHLPLPATWVKSQSPNPQHKTYPDTSTATTTCGINCSGHAACSGEAEVAEAITTPERQPEPTR